MKRIVTLFLTLSMIIAVGFALSSCDVVNQFVPSEKEDVITVEDGYLVVNGVKTEYKVLVEEENLDNTENGNGNQNGENTENGGTGNEVRTTVTAEEWAANLEQTNFTVDIEQTKGTETTIKGMALFTATAKYLEIFEPYQATIQFAIKDGISYQIFKTDNESWRGMTTDYPYASIESMVIGMFNSILLDYSAAYDSVVYNTEKKAYSYTIEDEDGTEWTYWFYFEEGKIIKAEIICCTKNEDGTEQIGYGLLSFRDIGKTVVEVPEFTIIDNGGNTPNDGNENGNAGSEIRTTVTAEEFEANMNQTNYTMSFEAEATYLQEPAYGMVMVSATATYSDLVSTGIASPVPYYVVKQDDVWYGVIESENGWIGQVVNISDENAIAPLVACVSIFNLDHTYDSLVYDTEKKAYTFTQEVEDGWQMYCYYFEEGKIIKCEMLDTDSYGNGRITLSISNIGTTVIEIPEFTVE